MRHCFERIKRLKRAMIEIYCVELQTCRGRWRLRTGTRSGQRGRGTVVDGRRAHPQVKEPSRSAAPAVRGAASSRGASSTQTVPLRIADNRDVVFSAAAHRRAIVLLTAVAAFIPLSLRLSRWNVDLCAKLK